VTTAVACGDLTQKIEIEVEGEMSTLKGMWGISSSQSSRFNDDSRCRFGYDSVGFFVHESSLNRVVTLTVTISHSDPEHDSIRILADRTGERKLSKNLEVHSNRGCSSNNNSCKTS